MITRDEILDSIKYVVDNSTYVKINTNNIDKIINQLQENKKKPWLDNDFLDIDKYSKNQVLMYLILCESLNFCYWNSDVKWKIEYKGKWYSGSYGLFYAISKAIKNGYDLLNIDYLEHLTIEEFDKIFKGTTSIPLLNERFNILKQLTSEFKTIVDLSKIINGNSDIELLNNIIRHFSNFRDISPYKGRDIYFFKRAILLVGDLILNMDYIKENIKNYDNMIGCADYKIPQVLRHLKILEYSPELAELVDNQQEIKHNSEMEVEIRANMIYVIELIREHLQQKGIQLNSTQIDNSLWLLSKNKEFKEKPHHLTKTIYY